MSPYDTSNSREELLSQDISSTDDIHIGHNSMPSSEADTPRQHEPTGKKRVDWSIPEDQEEELRTELHRVLTDANGPSSRDGTPSPPVISRPKSVLRKGDITPSYEPHDDIDDGIENIEDKAAAANDARERASRVADLSPSSRSPDSSPSRKRKRQPGISRRTMFHTSEELDSGAVTPQELHEDYVPRPAQWRTGGLSALSMAHRWFDRHSHSRRGSFEDSHGSTPSTPRRSPLPSRRGSTASLGDLIAASAAFGFLGGDATHDIARACRPQLLRSGSTDHPSSISDLSGHLRSGAHRSTGALLDTFGKFGSSFRPQSETTRFRIEKHLQDVKLRQRYLVKLSRALVQFGAPSHRLEEYMKMSARVLEIEAQFLYIPGCMLISFDDSRTHTAEVKIVRADQGIDLGKLVDTHTVYKEVVHDLIGVEEASIQLDEIIGREQSFHPWLRVLFFGLASASVGPFAYEARPIDIPVCFILGSVLGIVQVFLAQQSDLARHVWELLAVILTSCLARWLGSIQGGDLFCFSALAQSSITMILPGYIMLSGCLELQARSLIAGSVRIVWAIIYSMYLGFGLTIGTAIYGLADSNAVSRTHCLSPTPFPWFFISVPIFAFSVAMVNFAKVKHLPLMILIAFGGYVVSYFSAARFQGNSQISSAFGAMAVGVLANGYSRFYTRIEHMVNKMVEWPERMLSPAKDDGWDGNRWPGSKPIDLEKQDEVEAKSSGRSSMFERFLPSRIGRRSPNVSESSNNFEDDRKTNKLKKPSYPLAASAMIPAIMVLVPSGLSVAGSLLQGVETANQITRNSTGSTVTASDVRKGHVLTNNISFTVGYSIIQIAIGLGVGFFFGSFIVYPGGKTGKSKSNVRSGLFSF